MVGLTFLIYNNLQKNKACQKLSVLKKWKEEFIDILLSHRNYPEELWLIIEIQWLLKKLSVRDIIKVFIFIFMY